MLSGTGANNSRRGSASNARFQIAASAQVRVIIAPSFSVP
jgi:hypothetical protein